MPKSLKIVFAGTPEFAASALEACINSKHQVQAVYTQPDRPAGRGRKVQFGPVKQMAHDTNIPVLQPQRLEQAQFDELKKFNPDVMLVSAYGLLLPRHIMSIPRLGCINIHASLLPRWRGAAPIQRAIIAGDQKTGISIMQMVEALDAGPVLQTFSCDIQAKDTGSSLHDRLAKLAASKIIGVLEHFQNGELQAMPQNEAQACYANKISKQEACINWQESAQVIERKIRAFNAWPVAFTYLNDMRIRILQAELDTESHVNKPGKIIAVNKQGIKVATGEGVITVTTLQVAGGKIISAKDFLNAHNVQGQYFTTEATANHSSNRVSHVI